MTSAQPRPFGELLRRYRVAAGLTQQELAERAGLSARAIGALETGDRRAPRKDTVTLLATALHLAPADLDLFMSAARPRVTRAPGLSPRAPQSLLRRRPETTLVGRRDELAALERILAGEGPRLLALAGEPGIGKSRLLEEAVQRGAERGWTVLFGGCHRRSGQEPFAPFTGALTRFLSMRAPAQARRDLHGCGWLVRLLPELAEREIVPAPSWTLPPEQERRLMFGAAVRFLANVAGSAGVLLVLDDLHWAAGDALDLLAAVARDPGALQLRIVAAYRDTDVDPGAPFPMLLRDLAHEGLAEQTALGLLGRDDAMELLRALLDDEQERDEALLHALLDRAGGLPFFLASCAQDWQAQAVAGATTAGAVPWSAAESIRARVTVLPSAARSAIGAAAVAGQQVPRKVLVAAAGATGPQTEVEILTGLEAACRARLLAETDDGAYVFTHDLIRETILADLTGARRALLHRCVADAVEALPDAPRRAAELAWHFAEGDEPVRALRYAMLAGDRAEAVYAHDEAERSYRQALDLARSVGDRPSEAEALEKRADVLYRLTRYTEAYTCLEQAIQMYREARDWERLAWATAQLARAGDKLDKTEASLAQLDDLFATLTAVAEGEAGTSDAYGGPADGAEETVQAHARRAAAILTPRTAARLYLCLTSRLLFVGRHAEACAASEPTILFARRARLPRVESLAYAFRSEALREQRRLEEARVAAEAARVVAQACGDLEALSMAQYAELEVYELQGDISRCHDGLIETLRTVRELDDVHMILATCCNLAYCKFVLGDWVGARGCYEEAMAMATTRHGDPRQVELVGVALARLDLVQGTPGAGGATAANVLIEIERHGQPINRGHSAWALAERDLVAGQPEAARERLRAVGSEIRVTIPEANDFAALLAWAEVELGHVDLAYAALQQAGELTDAFPHHPARGAIARIAGLVALARGRWEEAEHALAEALALARRMPYPYAEAKALDVYGRLYAAKGEPERARACYEQALAICERLGERLYADRIERALSPLAARPSGQ